MQVPNRYYNSPWIADAARNLSIAFYGDPERDAARERSQYEVQRMRNADALAATERERAANARAALGRLAGAQEGDVPALLSEAITLGAPPEASFTAAGTASPKYRQQLSLQDARLSSALDQLNVRMGVQEELARMRDKTTQRGQDLTNEGVHYGADTRARTAESVARLRDQNGKPLDISPTDQMNLKLNIAQLATDFGGKLDPRVLDTIEGRAAQIYQATRNSSTAVHQAWTEIMGQEPTVVPGERGFFGFGSPGPTMLRPNLSTTMTAPPTAPAQRPPLAAFQR